MIKDLIKKERIKIDPFFFEIWFWNTKVYRILVVMHCLIMSVYEWERSKFQRVLRDFSVWRSIETRAWSKSRFESLRWVCEWLWDSRGEGDILTTCISSIFQFSLLFVVKEASQLWRAKSSGGSSLEVLDVNTCISI